MIKTLMATLALAAASSCSSNTECFSCTTDFCDWDGQSCVDKPEDSIFGISSSFEGTSTGNKMQVYGMTCPDIKNLCEKEESVNTTKLFFTKGKTIPKGYYCNYNLTGFGNDSFWTYKPIFTSSDDQVYRLIYKIEGTGAHRGSYTYDISLNTS
jgi:hypothetical protein